MELKTFKEFYLTEKFSTTNMDKATAIGAKILGKYFGGAEVLKFGVDRFRRKDGESGYGEYIMFKNTKNMIRVNWNLGEQSKGDIHSVDIFTLDMSDSLHNFMADQPRPILTYYTLGMSPKEYLTKKGSSEPILVKLIRNPLKYLKTVNRLNKIKGMNESIQYLTEGDYSEYTPWLMLKDSLLKIGGKRTFTKEKMGWGENVGPYVLFLELMKNDFFSKNIVQDNGGRPKEWEVIAKDVNNLKQNLQFVEDKVLDTLDMIPNKYRSGQVESIQNNTVVGKAVNILDETHYAHPDVIFEHLEKFTQMVVEGHWPALLIAGEGGIGKSYEVTKQLKNLNSSKYISIKGGKTTAISFYEKLWFTKGSATKQNTIEPGTGKLLVYDDCDSMLDSDDGMNLMKGALDTSEPREISWNTKNSKIFSTIEVGGYQMSEIQKEEKFAEVNKGADPSDIKFPASFVYGGRVILITNKTKDDLFKNQHLSAVMTRSFYIDINLMAKDKILRIESILPYISPETSMEDKIKNLNLLKQKAGFDDSYLANRRKFNVDEWAAHNEVSINIRTMIKANAIRSAGNSLGWTESKIDEMIKLYM
jgi:ribosomal protein L24E